VQDLPSIHELVAATLHDHLRRANPPVTFGRGQNGVGRENGEHDNVAAAAVAAAAAAPDGNVTRITEGAGDEGTLQALLARLGELRSCGAVDRAAVQCNADSLPNVYDEGPFMIMLMSHLHNHDGVNIAKPVSSIFMGQTTQIQIVKRLKSKFALAAPSPLYKGSRPAGHCRLTFAFLSTKPRLLPWLVPSTAFQLTRGRWFNTSPASARSLRLSLPHTLVPRTLALYPWSITCSKSRLHARSHR
jgi:hypothetical protein